MASHSALDKLHPLIVLNRGARYEAKIFQILLAHPHVYRSFEFGAVDGAVDCSTESVPLHGTYSERFWELNEAYNESHNDLDAASGLAKLSLLLFDSKGTFSGTAEHQVYITTTRQRQLAQFYVSTCAADPGFVELYPNYYAQTSSQETEAEERNVAVNLTRKALVHPTAYGHLSPCNAPYRMPVRLLSQAISQIRNCVRGATSIYTNPYTGVEFKDWHPTLVNTNKHLMPDEKTQHGSGYVGVVDIWRGVRTAKAMGITPMDFDFVNVQPRLADFKLLVPADPLREPLQHGSY